MARNGIFKQTRERNLAERERLIDLQDPDIQAPLQAERNAAINEPLIGALGGDALAFPDIAAKAQGLLGLPTNLAVGGLEALMQQGANQGPTVQAEKAQGLLEQTDLNRMRELQIQTAETGLQAAQNEQNFGFSSPEKAFEFGANADQMSNMIDSLSTQIKVREDLGAIDPVNYLTSPDSVAAVQLFNDFETVNMFKTLANDTRVSDEDRDFYRNILDFGFTDWLTSGGKVNLSKLRTLRQKLRGQREVLATSNPAGAARFADKFTEIDQFADLPGGVPFDPRREPEIPVEAPGDAATRLLGF